MNNSEFKSNIKLLNIAIIVTWIISLCTIVWSCVDVTLHFSIGWDGSIPELIILSAIWILVIPFKYFAFRKVFKNFLKENKIKDRRHILFVLWGYKSNWSLRVPTYITKEKAEIIKVKFFDEKRWLEFITLTEREPLI